MPCDVICPDLSAGPSGSPGHVGCGSAIVEPLAEFFRRPGRSPDADELQAFLAALAEPFFAAASAAGSLASMTSTEPPAFSTAATAPFDAPATLNETFAVNSPLPS